MFGLFKKKVTTEVQPEQYIPWDAHEMNEMYKSIGSDHCVHPGDQIGQEMLRPLFDAIRELQGAAGINAPTAHQDQSGS